MVEVAISPGFASSSPAYTILATYQEKEKEIAIHIEFIEIDSLKSWFQYRYQVWLRQQTDVQ